MAVAFRSGSNTGNSTSVTTIDVPVPSGAAAGDIAVVSLAQWSSGAIPTVTPPAGFAQKSSVWTSGNGQARNSTWWKRLTAGDTGNYTFSWTGSFWTTGQCALFTGCATSGDPWDAIAAPVAGTFGTITSMSVTMTDAAGGLFWTNYNDTGGTHTPPTNFTEFAEADCASSAYWIPGASGSQSAASGSISSSGPAGAWLGALLSDAGAVGAPIKPTLVGDQGTVANTTAATTSSVTITSPTTVTVGNYLIARVAVDNSGTNGAAPGCTVTDPRSNTWTVLGPALVDPGAAAAGATAYLCYARVVTAYQAADALTFNWGGVSTTAKAVVVEEWASIDATTPVAVSAVTNNAAASTAVSVAITPTAANQMVYTCLATEGIAGDTVGTDSDTTNGSWFSLTPTASANATATNNQRVSGAYKIVTAAGAQSWDSTITNRDWAALAVVFAPPTVGVATRGSGNSSTTDTTSHSITLPSGVTAGDLLVVVFSVDGNPTCSTTSTGWWKVAQASNSTVVTGAVFAKYATGSDALTVTTSASEQSSHISLRIPGGGALVATSANGSSTNSDPPSLTDTSDDHLWIVTRSGDASSGATVNATVAPTGYANLTTQNAADTNGATTATAEKTAMASVTENPGVFTSATEQWVSWTIGVVAKRTGAPLGTWGAAKATVGSARAKWLAIGDSLTEGQGASTRANRWTELATTAIRRRTGAIGSGLGYLAAIFGVYAPDSTWQPFSARSGTIADEVWGGNPGWRQATMSAGATQTFTVTGTHCEVWYLGNGGTFTWAIDGGSATSVNTANGGVYVANLKTSVISLGAAGSHTVLITATVGTVYLSGLTVYNDDSTTGITLYDGGHTGHTSFGSIGDTVGVAPEFVGTLGTVAPDLVSIELGLNDQGGGLTPSQTVINIRQLIAALRGLPTVPSIVLIIAYTPDASTGITQWADYVTAMRMLAVGDGMLTAIDLSASMPAATTAGTGYYRTDGLHPNDSGHALIALQFAAIVAPDASGRPQSYVPRRRAANW